MNRYTYQCGNCHKPISKWDTICPHCKVQLRGVGDSESLKKARRREAERKSRRAKLEDAQRRKKREKEQQHQKRTLEKIKFMGEKLAQAPQLNFFQRRQLTFLTKAIQKYPYAYHSIVEAFMIIENPDILLPLLDHENQAVRAGIIEALVRLETSAHVEPLIAIAGDNQSLRGEVIYVLSKILDNIYSPSQHTIYDPKLGPKTMTLLSEMHDARAVKPLSRCLKHKKWDIRLAAVEALAQLKQDAAIQVLMSMVEDRSKKVRLAAIQAVGQKSG